MNFTLTQIEREKIKQLHRSCREREFADKLKSLLLLGKGFSCAEVGGILLLDDGTIRKYRTQYLGQGAGSMLADNNKGASPRLNEHQTNELEKHLEENTYSSTKGIIAWVKECFGITYTINGINSLLKRLGFVYKKPVLAPCKADVRKQEGFIVQYKGLKNRLEGKGQIYFMDGVHPQLNSGLWMD